MGNYRKDSLFTDSFAYGLSKNILTDSELYDYDVINQSIEMILSTIRGERVFLPQMGSDLPLVLFEDLNSVNSEQLLSSIIETVELWEDRITIIRDRAKLEIYNDTNSLDLTLPYVLNDRNITNTFIRTIVL